MKKKKLLVTILATTMLLSTAFSFAGCGEKKSSDGDKAATVTKDKEQKLNLMLIEPLTLDVNKCQDSDSTTTLNAVQEGLVRIKNLDGKKDEVVLAGAESKDTSKDGLVWTFKLRDYKWSDGKPVTAQQYVDSFVRLMTKKNAFPYAFFGFNIKNGEAFYNGTAKAEDLGFKAKDDKTVEITLEKPEPFFLDKLTNPVFDPIRLDVIKNAGDNYDTDITKQVYCGPYKIKEWNKQNSITFEKNPDYWDAKNVSIETVNMKKIEEFATQAQLFESKGLDVTGSLQEYVKKWTEDAKAGKFVSVIAPIPNNTFVVFNQKTNGFSGLMGNAKIRKALSLAIDREDYTKTILGRYYPAYGLVPNAINMGNDEYRAKATEPLKADYDKYKGKNEELQKMFHEGLKELGKDTPDLKNIKLNFITTGNSALDKQAQEWWKQNFEKVLGITIDMKVYGDFKVYKADMDAWKFDMCVRGWNADYNDAMTFLDQFESTNGNNVVAYKNPEYDKLIKSLEGENDQAKRFEIYQKLEKMIVCDDAGVAPVVYLDTRKFVQNYVKDFGQPKFGATYDWRWTYTSGRQ